MSDNDSHASPDSGGSTEGGHKHQRKLRNYLLDKRFQLKYTGIVIGITALLSAVLGYYLHQQIVASQRTILARDLGESTIVVEPGDTRSHDELLTKIDEEVTEAFKTREFAVVVKINNAPRGTTAQLYSETFEEESSRLTAVLVLSLVVFLVVLAGIWVYLTHKIAGPVFKLKLLFSKIDGSNLCLAGRLRKGDELQEAFVAFADMLERLRNDRRSRAEKLARIADALEGDGSGAEAAKELREMRATLLDSLKE
jgi:sensor histidine kinase YesM